MSFSIVNQVELIAFWLVFTRWYAIMMQFPLFDTFSIPGLIKILTALVISYAFYPIVSPEVLKDISFLGADNFWLLTIYYSFIGLAIGFIVRSIMSIFSSAGTIITQHAGFAAINYFDPQAGQQVGPFEKIISWTIVTMIITSGALIPMFKGAVQSFHTIHIYDLGNLSNSPLFFINFFKSIFLSALLLASPLIFTNILIMAVLGISARVVPQLNIIMISFVINIGLGLLVFIASSEEFFQVGFKIYSEKLAQWFQFII